MDLLLKNITWNNGLDNVTGDVRICRDSIQETGQNLQPKKSDQVVDFKNHFLYPGLINAHDHLEMNLYPRLGNPPYRNYIEWTSDVYKPAESPVREIEKVDIEYRLLWGGLKNLIAGVTTVVHHNPWHRSLGSRKFPLKVLKDYAWAHSLHHGKNISESFPKKENVPFIIHVAEGTDEVTSAEISKLHSLGLLKSNSVLIHGVALRDTDIQLLKTSQCTVVWCPASNLFMFDTTAPITKLKSEVKVALGSDSTMTGSPTLLDELKTAARTNLADPKTLYEMVTKTSAKIFNLPTPDIATSTRADFFISPIKHPDYFENLLALTPTDVMLVAIDGDVKLLDSDVDLQLRTLKRNSFILRGRTKNVVTDIVTLKMRIERKVGNAILEKNPLWTLIEI